MWQRQSNPPGVYYKGWCGRGVSVELMSEGER